MRGVKRHQLRLGLPAGVLAFLAGWAIAAFLSPLTVLPDQPRWQATLWVYLGAHFIELSNVYTGGTGLGGSSLEEFAPGVRTDWVPIIPGVLVGVATVYACYEMPYTSRMKFNIRNALTVGTGYFLAGLGAMIISDMQPGFTMVLIVGLVVGAAIWLGSSFVGALTRGLPFFGIASLGTIAMIGLLLLLGGVTLIATIWGLILMSFGVPVVVGAGISASRTLEKYGQRGGSGDFPRLEGLNWLVRKHAKGIGATVVILLALLVGLRGGM